MADMKRQWEGRFTRVTRQSDAALTKEVEHYQKQLKIRETEISQLESMHSAVKAQYEQRVLDLESGYAKTKDKLKLVRLAAALCTGPCGSTTGTSELSGRAAPLVCFGSTL